MSIMISLRIDEGLKKRLEIAAKKDNRTRSAMIKKILHIALFNPEKKTSK